MDIKDIDKVAHLARLAIHEQDKPGYAKDLNNILNLVDQLQSVDTNAVMPLANPLGETLRARQDVVTEADNPELQQLSTAHEGRLYLVPQVIDKTAE